MSLDGSNALHPGRRCTNAAWGEPCSACTQLFPPSYRSLCFLGHGHPSIPLAFQATASKKPHFGAEEEEAGAMSCSRMPGYEGGWPEPTQGLIEVGKRLFMFTSSSPRIHPRVSSPFFQPGPSFPVGVWSLHPGRDWERGTWKDPNSQPAPERAKFI